MRLQHHNSKVSILLSSAFIVYVSAPYRHPEKVRQISVIKYKLFTSKSVIAISNELTLYFFTLHTVGFDYKLRTCNNDSLSILKNALCL